MKHPAHPSSPQGNRLFTVTFVICVTGILVALAVWYSRSTEEVDGDVQKVVITKHTSTAKSHPAQRELVEVEEVRLSVQSLPASPENDAKQKRAMLLASQLDQLGLSLSNGHSVSVSATNSSKK